MTTASSPPPRDGEVCTCGHRLAHHVSVGGCCIGACLCVVARPAAPSEPPAADSPTPGTEGCCKVGVLTCRNWRHCDRFCPAAPSPVDATEPPAETQQDDECPQWNRDENGDCLNRPAKASHVVDRDGNVWFLCPEYDGGMATRATAIGPISAGIAWLEREAGPLLPFDPIAYRRSYPRTAR